MLGINCLVNRPALKDELRDLVSEYADLLITMDRSPSVYGVYSILRKEGYEMDAQTVSEFYRDLFSGQQGYSSDKEIDAFSNRAYIDLFEAEAEEMKVKEIGRESPVTAVVSSLMNGVRLMSDTVPSLQKVFQDRLLKAAKRVTGYKAEKSDSNKTAEQILTEVLSIEKNNPFGQGFSAMNNAEFLWKEFKKEFLEVADQLYAKGDVFEADKIKEYADILEAATYKLMMSTAEVQKVINDTLREAGYKKQVNAQSGTREIVDWNKVFSDSDFNFRDTFKNVFRPKGFSESELDRIAEELEGEYDKMRQAKVAAALNQRNKKTTSKPQKSAIQRLQQLYQYGIFNSSQQQALFKVLGVQPTTATQLNQLNQLMALNNRMLNDPISKWSDVYLETIKREIEIIIEQAEENRSSLLKAIRSFSFYNQISNAMILGNAQNITENTLSGLFQYAATNVFTQPREAVKTLRVAFNTWIDVVKGGVREGHEVTNAFNNSANAETRFNFESAKTGSQKVMAAINWIPRATLSAMDNAIKAGLIHQISIDMLKSELRRQGLDKDEVELVIAEGFYGNRAELEEIAKQMQAQLQSAGINVASGKWKRMAAQLAWANMASDGRFFSTIISNLKSAGKLRQDADVDLHENMLKAIQSAAEAAASKGLGHQADSMLMKLFADFIPKQFGKAVIEARNKGRGLEAAELGRSFWGQANKFRYGAMRWTWLTLEKTTGLALLQTLVTDVLLNKFRRKGRHFLYSKIDFNVDFDDTKDVERLRENLEWYASLKQRLIRESAGPIVGYFSLVLVQSLFSSGGDDEEKKEALLDTAIAMQENRQFKRWMQKLLPARSYAYLLNLAETERGEVKYKYPDEFDLPDNVPLLEMFLGLKQVMPAMYSNINESGMADITKGIDDIKKGRSPEGWAKIGKALIGSVVTSPLSVFDVQTGPFKKNPLLDSEEYNQLEPKGFLEGVGRGLLNKDLWKRIKVGQDQQQGSSVEDLLRQIP